MINGCLDWQRNGLARPAVVKDATAGFFSDQDSLSQWLGERCRIVTRKEAPSSALFRDWQEWTKGRGEEAGTMKSFSAALERRHSKRRTNKGVVFEGG